MTFFEDQARARRNTTLLVFLYALCVLCIVLAVYAGLLFMLQKSLSSSPQLYSSRASSLVIWQPDLFWGTFGVVLAVIGIGTIFRVMQLLGGGPAVARMLGGIEIPRNSSDPNHRRVLNVVEEMAIASGMSVPPVFLLPDEEGINAFAAGYSTKDAVIAVTSGCINLVSRDELQGIVAHEFSHIFNGDMRLNIKLVSVLSGIVLLSTVGYVMMRSMQRVSFRKKDNPAALIAMVGVMVYAFGYIGLFFARIIQSAVSRQREFLADASAVQFTRNPSGLGAALAKIGGYSEGSTLSSSRAQELSHFFFAQGIAEGFFGLFATHPPIRERIKRIAPQLLVQLDRYEEGTDNIARVASAEEVGVVSGFAPREVVLQRPSPQVAAPQELSPQKVEQSMGRLNPGAIEYAQAAIHSFGPTLRRLAADPSSARAVVLALLLQESEPVRTNQLRAIKTNLEPWCEDEVRTAEKLIAAVPGEQGLALASLVLPALRQLSAQNYVAFRRVMRAFVVADGVCDLFEYALLRMYTRKLDSHFALREEPIFAELPALGQTSAALRLIEVLAQSGSADEGARQRAFAAGTRELGYASPPGPCSGEPLRLPLLDQALRGLERASLDARRRVLRAAVAAVVADGEQRPSEMELLRAIAETLDCPIPPLF